MSIGPFLAQKKHYSLLIVAFFASNAIATHTSFNDGKIHNEELGSYSGSVEVTSHSTWIGNLSNAGDVGVDVKNSKWRGDFNQEGDSASINISSNSLESYYTTWEGDAYLWYGNTKINLDGPVLWDGDMIASFGDATKQQNIEVNMMNRSAWWGDADINTVNDNVGNAKLNITDSTWRGGLKVIGDVTVSVNMSDHSLWYGSASQSDNAAVHVALDKSAWLVTKDSDVETLALNSGAVDISRASLTVKNLLAKDGFFHVDSASANRLDATTAKGNLFLMEGGTIAGRDTSHAVLKVEEVDNTKLLKVEGWAEHGLYTYIVKEVEPGNYYFRKSGRVSSAGGIIQSMSAAPTVVSSMHNDTLFERQEDFRLSSTDKGGVWLSYFGGINRSTTTDNAAFKLHTNGVMLGGDTLIETNNGYWLAGLAVSNSQTNLTTPGHNEYAEIFESKNNNGEIKSYGMHAYLSRQYDNGIFIDTSLGFYHFKNSADINTLNNIDAPHYHLGFSLNGFGGAVKAGYHYLNSSGVFAEPYARVSTMTNENVSYLLSDSTVKNKAFNSIQGEIGGKLGMKFPVQNAEINPYLQVALLNEFAGGNKVYLNSESANSSIDNTSVRIGAGVQASLTENVGAYARLSYLKGENTEEPLQGLFGVKVFF